MQLAVAIRGFLPLMAVFSLLIAAVVFAQMYLFSSIIAGVFINSSPPSPTVVIAAASTIVLRGLLIWLRERLAERASVRIRSGLRQKLLRQLIDAGPAFTRKASTGALVTTVMEGVDKLDDYFTRFVPSLVHIALLPAIVIALAFYIDWPSGLVMLVTGPLIVFFMWLIGTYATQITQRQWHTLSRLSAHFLDAIQGLKTLKLFGVSRQEAQAVEVSSEGFRAITMQVLRVAFLSGFVLELAASISIALVAVQVGIRLIEGLMPFQPALFMLLLAPEFYLPFRTLGQHHHAGMEGVAAAEKVFDVIDSQKVEESKVEGQRSKTEGQKSKVEGQKSKLEIEFSDVIFSYPGSGEPALYDVSFRMEAGTMTALVGHTGSGKTTLAYLLLGYLRPASGSIMVDGEAVDGIDPVIWRRKVAFVPQHPRFFSGSVFENLVMARPGAGIDDVEEAARLAGAHDFISKLPRAYRTLLTENASCLSGGERQRLAIARAFLKDASLLILDEPSSMLDKNTEQLVTDATERLSVGRTTLIIAHRLQTVRRASNIIVLDRGQVAERGNHESLMARQGIYATNLDLLEINGGGKP